MNATPHTGNTQSTLWNGHSGCAWVELQPLLDQMFRPLENLLVDAVRTHSPHHVLDVGSGTGSTTIAMAKQIGTQGHCTGVDISAPMIATAKARAQRDNVSAGFINADVQTHAFEPAHFDMIVSRFGVMFFDQPVEAFTNLRRAAKNNALLNVIAWRSAAENPFMTTTERAAAPLLEVPARPPGAPGQFAFADRDKVTTILRDSGWGDVDIQPIDVECAFPVEGLVNYFTRLGPIGQAVQSADEKIRMQVIDAVRPAFDAYVHGNDVRYVAACWTICARATPASAKRR